VATRGLEEELLYVYIGSPIQQAYLRAASCRLRDQLVSSVPSPAPSTSIYEQLLSITSSYSSTTTPATSTSTTSRS